MQRIILGTAQWGLNYGITNSHGRLQDDQIREIVELSSEWRISRLDTASVYGDSEVRIADLARNLEVQTKIAMTANSSGMNALKLLERSLGRLARKNVDSCLIWDWEALSPVDRMEALESLRVAKESGLTHAIGVSIYSPEEIARIAYSDLPIDIVQAPISILDQRLLKLKSVLHLVEKGVKFQARSVFLQGIALGDEYSIFGRHPDVARLREIRKELDVSAVELCLLFIKSIPWIHEIILAPTSQFELRELMNASNVLARPELDFSQFASLDIDLIDPRRWEIP